MGNFLFRKIDPSEILTIHHQIFGQTLCPQQHRGSWCSIQTFLYNTEQQGMNGGAI